MNIAEMFESAAKNHRCLTNEEARSLGQVVIMTERLDKSTHSDRAFRAAMILRDNPTHHTIAFRDDFQRSRFDIFTADGFDRVRDSNGVQFAY